jgi:hypothetical protein
MLFLARHDIFLDYPVPIVSVLFLYLLPHPLLLPLFTKEVELSPPF